MKTVTPVEINTAIVSESSHSIIHGVSIIAERRKDGEHVVLIYQLIPEYLATASLPCESASHSRRVLQISRSKRHTYAPRGLVKIK